MLKLERHSDGERPTIRLIGRVRSEHLGEITNQMGSCGPNVTLDLQEVTVVDVEVVRDADDWNRFEAARRALSEKFGNSQPAPRYAIRMQHPA
jgi:hypothetical protein